MSTSVSITKTQLLMLAAYNKAHYVPTYVIHTPPESAIGGFGAEFVEFDGVNVMAKLKKANGDTFFAPISEITIRVQF